MRSFKEYWNEHGDVYAMEIAEDAWDYQQAKIDELQKQRDSFIKAYEIEMEKSIELQRRVDAAKYYMKNIFSGDAEVDQCHLGDLLDILDGKIVDEIEQALNGEVMTTFKDA